MKKIYIINILVILVGIFLLFSASKDMSTYGTFDAASANGKRMKVAGELVKDKEMKYDPEVDANAFSFYMMDADGHDAKVLLNKPKPQDFERSEQVVVTGSMKEGIFVADELLMKCPSKYKDEEINLRNQG